MRILIKGIRCYRVKQLGKQRSGSKGEKILFDEENATES